MRVLALWGVATLLAVFVGVQRSEPQDASASVLVARQFIPAGTSGSRIADRKMVEATRLPRNEAELEAVDLEELRAGVTLRDVFPGAQITASDLQP